MEVKFSIEGVDYYQLAALVEAEIINRGYSTSRGEAVALSTRRTFSPTGLAHRLEIGVDGNFVYPITIDCHTFTGRMLVTVTCTEDDHQPIVERLAKEICHYMGLPDPISSPAPPRPSQAPSRPPQAEQPASPDKERAIKLGTAQRVAEVKYRILTQGLSKTAACDLVAMSHKTYNRWEDDELVDRLLQEMLEHPPEL